jgi:hypothetical protein
MEKKNYFSSLNDRALKLLNRRPVLCHFLLAPVCVLIFHILIAVDIPPLGYPVFTSYIFGANYQPESLWTEFVTFQILLFTRLTQIDIGAIFTNIYINVALYVLYMLLFIVSIPQLLLWAYRKRKNMLVLFILAIVVLDIVVIYANGYYTVACFNCVIKLPGNQTISEEELYRQCGRPLYTTQYILNNEARTKEICGYYTNGFSEKCVIYKDNGIVFIRGTTDLWMD